MSIDNVDLIEKTQISKTTSNADAVIPQQQQVIYSKKKNDDLLKDLDVLNVQNWPDKYDIQYGDKFVRRLATQFQVDEILIVRGFREFKDTTNLSLVYSLRPLIVAINTINKSFSTMNIIATWKRNALTPKHLSSLLLIQCIGPLTNSRHGSIMFNK
ncbi:Hypothetical protein CINCED_3A017400 [Cinara cedri]|uniref:Uncharacterized protein n=1 Tax=Cinara cedri TaxID=506608 RepID=A0A5E4N7L0_9HEMI|nr:Hypothetical protein CINCED_3A017400 [Cinara cedri]